jgi:hypothetical protein
MLRKIGKKLSFQRGTPPSLETGPRNVRISFSRTSTGKDISNTLAAVAIDAQSGGLWGRHANHIRWTMAALGSVSVAHAVFEQAVKNRPQEHFTLRQGMMPIREHSQK